MGKEIIKERGARKGDKIKETGEGMGRMSESFIEKKCED